MVVFDYIIIGAGPSGLTCAWILAKKGYSVCIVDRLPAIGGAHFTGRTASSIKQTNEATSLFYEHGPKFITDQYVTMKSLHEDINDYLAANGIRSRPLAFDALFTPFEVSIVSAAWDLFSILNWTELSKILYWFAIGGQPHVSVEQYIRDFSDRAKAYIDRLCRLSDGANMSNTSAAKFFNAATKGNLYTLRQPSDKAWMFWWKRALESRGVIFRLNYKAKVVSKEIDNITIIDTNKINSMPIRGRKLICAVPPQALANIVGIIFKPDYLQTHSYISYWTIVFHWNTILTIRAQGLPLQDTPWGLAFVQQSQYFNREPGNTESPTIVSVLVSRADQVGHNGKTASQCDRDEIVAEVLRQLQDVVGQLPSPIASIYANGPGDFPAYVDSLYNVPYGPETQIPGIYSIGTHNERSNFGFTTFESACQNAVWFCGNYV